VAFKYSVQPTDAILALSNMLMDLVMVPNPNIRDCKR
jgi:hypothetical protein